MVYQANSNPTPGPLWSMRVDLELRDYSVWFWQIQYSIQLIWSFQGQTSHSYLQPNPVQNLYFVPVYSTTRPRNAVDVVLQDDFAPLVGLSAGHYAPSYSYQPLSDYYASAASSQTFSQAQDDLTYRMRPDTNSVLNRTYNSYGPLQWSWKDFTQRSGSVFMGGVNE